MAATVAAPVAEPATMPRYRFSFEEYQRMSEVGIFDEDSPVELIRGEIVEMAAQGAAHVACVGAVYRTLARQLGDAVIVLLRCTIRLPGPNAPEPDLAIVRPTYDRRSLPTPPDILVIGEVSDSTLAHDRREKLPLYAESGIPEAWLFNLVDGQIERYTAPRDGQYHQIALATRGERLASTVLPSLTFDVDEVLGADDTDER